MPSMTRVHALPTIVTRFKLWLQHCWYLQLYLPLQKLAFRTGHHCKECRAPVDSYEQTLLWCETCFEALEPKVRCSRCGLPMTAEEENPPIICGECLKKPPNWQSLICVSDYDEPLKRTIYQLKYNRDYRLSTELSVLLDNAIVEYANTADGFSYPTALVSVPVPWLRQWRRGYNQSERLVLALIWQWHLKGRDVAAIHPFARKPSSQRHTSMNKKQRLIQAKSEFRLNRRAAKALQGHNHVAIVDDVVTTGATAQQLCKLLLEIGVKRIDIYCICRTAKPKC